jgi:hypothetical protein
MLYERKKTKGAISKPLENYRISSTRDFGFNEGGALP